MNPLIRTVANTTRGWTDADSDFVPDCDLNSPAANGECARWTTRTWGGRCSPDLRPQLRRRLGQPAVQLGARPVGAARSGAARLGDRRLHIATGGATGTSWTTGRPASRTTRRSASTAPLDPRLPGGGGYTISGLYNLVPAKVGQVDELAQSYKNFGEQTENWQGIDVSVWRGCRTG